MSKKTPKKTIEDLYTSDTAGSRLKNGVLEVGPIVEYPSKRKEEVEDMHEEFGEDYEEQELVRIPARGRKKTPDEVPLENNEPIPLIPNIDKGTRNTAHSIQVHKMTPPMDGYKGDVPLQTSLDFIGRRYGDGIYTFVAINQAGQELRRNQNVKIALTGNPEGSAAVPRGGVPFIPPRDPEMAERLLERQAMQHDKDAERAQKISDRALDVTQRLSQDYATMIREDGKVRSERDREYFRAQNEQQVNMFSTLIAQMQQMHQQSMEQQRESFNQTVQIMQMTHQQVQAANNPAVLFSLFEKGLAFAREAGTEGSDPVASILQTGVSGLREFREMMSLQSQAGRPNPAIPQMPAQSTVPSPKTKGKKPPLERAELVEVLKLKKIAEAKGYEFDDLVKKAQMMVGAAPSAYEESDEGEVEDEPEEGEEEDTGEDTEA